MSGLIASPPQIRHYGLLANAGRKDNISQARALLQMITDSETIDKLAANESAQPAFICPDCGATMVIVRLIAREPHIRAPPWQRVAA